MIAPTVTPTTTILPGLHTLALPTPFPVGTVNVYVAEGDALTLIDCGMRTDASYEALTVGLAQLGYQMRDIQRLLITHHHTDHLGAAQRVVEASGAEVIAHPYCVPHLETPHAVRTFGVQYATHLFREQGVPAHVIDLIGQNEAALEALVGTAKVAQTLDEGDLISLVGRTWHVLHTPGHARDLICLFEPESRVLLSADHLLRDTRSNPLIEPPAVPGDPRPRNLIDYFYHLDRLAALTPLIAYTGHGEPITDIAALVATRHEQRQRRTDKVLALLIDQPQTLYELVQAVFPHVPEGESYLTLSEVLGHVDILEQDQRVRSEQRADGVFVWSVLN